MNLGENWVCISIFQRACSDLEMHPLDVVYTQNLEETVLILASMTSDLDTRWIARRLLYCISCNFIFFLPETKCLFCQWNSNKFLSSTLKTLTVKSGKIRVLVICIYILIASIAQWIWPLSLCEVYTALNSPSLIFALKRSETDSPSLEFAHLQIFLHNPLYIF